MFVLFLTWFCAITVIQSNTVENNFKTSDLITNTFHGPVQGSPDGVSRRGRPFIKFLGIPYAKPPVGNYRFKPPRTPKPWRSIRNTNKEGNNCLQKNYLGDGAPIDGNEDCLYLNVFTHKVSPTFNRSPRPVLVYIHGGGWFSGTGATLWNGPEFFMDQDVVFVTFNYRLGVFGFFSTGDDVAPGNWGLKDQLLALQWIQQNIQYFGGDPNSVTVFGQSAGGASIHYHMLSPLSRGLFHRAIVQSGTALVLWAQPQNAVDLSQKQAQFVKCPDTNSSEIFHCLQKVDALALLNSADNFKFWSIDPLVTYTVAIEKKTALNPKPYITEDPYVLLKSKNIANSVPLIMGTVPDEGTIRGAKLAYDHQLRSELNARFWDLGPKLLETYRSVQDSDGEIELYRNMTEYYLDGEFEINDNNTDSFLNMYSDRAVIYSTYQTALRHMEANFEPVYFYHFNYKGVYSYTAIFAGPQAATGVGHCDDLLFLLRTNFIFPDLPLNHSDVQMSEKLVTLWTNFAKYGNPTPTTDTINVIWKPLPTISDRPACNSDLNYLNIENTRDVENDQTSFKMETNFYAERMRFWESLPILQNN